ncbi:coiled-coil domain-containing protein 37 [Asbolus verrucosus]|uniref:Coiled-coil domain-containing protein 37 n=1 Tax=Asbolus verrucosus TaxID=1661398 RepID=A0A482V7H6_ASBVE|nr:coiled-coil domain-containing protein 37 [Asbolus verrucosus]
MSSGEPSDLSSLRVNYDAASKKVRFGVKKEIRKIPIKLPSIRPRYFTAGCGINNDNQRDLLNEPSPFVYPKDSEEFAHKIMAKAWKTEFRRKELSCKYNKRHTYKSRQQADILSRLYVEEPELKSVKMIKDVDSEFFSIIEGRPIQEKLNLRQYIQTVRDVLRTKIITGYRGDDIMLIDENLILEQKQIDLIMENYQTYVNAFEELLYNDHTESMNLLKESDSEVSAAQEKCEELRQLSKEYAALKSVLYTTEERWRNCKLYQRFLYMVSPMSWRKENDYYYTQERDLNPFQEISSIFGKYRLNGTDEGSSLEDLISQFREECAIQKEPVLYFTEPHQLLDVFRFMELQNLNSLLYSEELAVPLENVKEGMARAEQLFNSEISALQELIDKLAEGISWEEERVEYLEEMALELINGEFKKLVIADDVLNLHVFVEDVYETHIGLNDANLNISKMMKMIESKFREELINLDQMPSEQVAQLESSCYREEAKMIKEAYKAARHLSEFEKLFLKLQKVFYPPFRKTTKELKWRSPPVNPPKLVPQPPRSLTEEEKDFLEFFTEYCKYSDDLKTYGIDISPQKPEGAETISERKEEKDEAESGNK